jgi:LPXTG-site transpeptidase (sortase) family protein
MRTRAAIFLLNVVSLLVIIAFFFPQWLPFMHSSAATTVVIPADVKPVDGRVASDGQVTIAGKPTRIKIPAVMIDLPVTDGLYNAETGKWTLTTDKAQYAVMTPYANNVEGNTFIYGHNRRSVFASLLNLKVGDMVYLETDNHKVFEYKLRSYQDVSPTDVSLFTYRGKPILTIQTCSGTWYQNRRMFTFDFVQVKEQV